MGEIRYVIPIAGYKKEHPKPNESVEINCQLDKTEVFIADLIACSTCFGHQYAHHQELKSIIQWLLPVVFRTHNPQIHTRPAT